MIRKIAFTTSLLALAFATGAVAKPAHQHHAKAAPAKPVADKTDGWGDAGIQTWWVDKSVKPGDDFERYVNGKWYDQAEIPSDRTSTGGFIVLRDLSETRMKAIFDELVASNPAPGTDAARVAAAYKAFMDTDAIEKRGLAPIQPQLDRIKAATTVEALADLFMEPAIPSPINVGVGVDAKKSDSYAIYARQGGLGLPDRDMYLQDNPRFKEFQAAYKKYMTFIFTELGHADPAKSAEDVYALEYKIAEATWDRALGRNRDLTYNKLSLDEFAALAPQVPMKAMIAKASGGKVNEVIVAQLPPTPEEIAAAKLTPEQAGKLSGGVPAIARMIASEPASVWQAWLAKNIVMGTAPVLPKRFDDANFAFYGKLLSGQPEQRPRWKRGIATVEGMVGELVGKIYAERHFPAANKAAMEKLVANLRLAMAANLKDLKWMGPETRVQAQAKLDAFDPKIGYPVKFKTYEGLDFKADDPVGNALAASRWYAADEISRLGKPVDRTEWGMLPQTVNAYYNSTKNEIVFPAAILQPPFFNLKADDAVNYGAIGAVIGHEMGHGFDDQGSKSDGAGNLRDWWTPEDKANFVKLTDALVGQYSKHCPIDETSPGGKGCINGRLTLGENIGDLGGISLAYRAYKLSLGGKKAPVIGGLTGDQRFFMAYAQVFRVKMREAALRQQLLTDPHSPGRFRINGIVPNIDEWYKAFNVKPGDKMYMPPEQRIRIW
ncbi:M13 family metallopeptidase [Novosphingobium sp. TH158]|uniref:M13 family metallopeptidase n=1 Tax=Novosphingobium sp. TH158 TaxID=2067455 RepID=UPI000C7C9D60|nr:M13-type metalloendopeptidase [Novosphingobium sp. TH158]PLK27361.1 zinc metalloprotease [Novosphingobium sp. TH158]